MPCGRNSKAFSIGLFSALGGFLFGYHTGVISGVLVMEDFQYRMGIYTWSNASDAVHNANAITGAIVGILLSGCFVGALLGGQASDRFSRKHSICCFSILFTVAAGVQTILPENISFLISRFFTGISIGALSMIVPIYHSEIATSENRGRMITLQQGAITLGIAVSFWINIGSLSLFCYDLCDDNGWEWRLPFIIQMIPSSILAIGILKCPHSPRWLISQDREDAAKEVLMMIRSAHKNEIEEEFLRIRDEVAYLREHEVETYRQLFRFPLLRPLLLGMGIQMFQQLTGINSLIYYTPKIFENYSGDRTDPIMSFYTTGIYGCVNLIFTIPVMIVIDRIGRRTLLMIGATFMSILMLIVSILLYNYGDKFRDNTEPPGSDYSILVLVGIFVAVFGFSWGPIPWLYCTEIFPLTMRAKATSITTATNWAVNCAISFLVPTLLSSLQYGLFLIFSILCGVMIIIVYLFYPETRGRHLERSLNNENSRIFVPQWLNNRRRTYNTLSSQSTVDPIHNSTDNESNPFH